MVDKNYIDREKIIDKIQPFIRKNVIKVIVGQRRVGKSYALKQIQDQISGEIILINKELYEFDHIKTYHDLIQYIETQAKESFTSIFIDEIQDIEEFEKALRHFQASEKYDIYCTGSNAKLLSGELATYLSGRYVQFNVHSLSFQEFQTFHPNTDFEDYLTYGGMPYLKNLTLQTDIAFEYLHNLYESIVLKDVVERHALRNIRFLKNLTIYLCNNIGCITSANNIAKFLKSQKTSINVTTIINYIEALKNCFFIHEVPRYDIEGKKVFEINHKYYVEDIGIRNSIVGYNQARDDAKLLENIVFMHLLRRHYKIHVGVIGHKEIDFIAEKDNEKIYIQVALTIDNNETFAREFGNLQLIKDNYPKYVVTREAKSINTIEGIQHVSIENFLSLI